MMLGRAGSSIPILEHEIVLALFEAEDRLGFVTEASG